MLDRARHEFGHHIAGRAVGFDTGGVSAEISGISGGSSAIITNRALMSVSDVEQFCEDRIKVLYAGVLAEALSGGAVDNTVAVELARSTGGVDHRMVQQLCNLLRNIRYSADDAEVAEGKMQSDENRLWGEASAMVEEYAPLIHELAQELYDRRAVDGQLAVMTEAELNDHPSILKHFP